MFKKNGVICAKKVVNKKKKVGNNAKNDLSVNKQTSCSKTRNASKNVTDFNLKEDDVRRLSSVLGIDCSNSKNVLTCHSVMKICRTLAQIIIWLPI